MLLPVMSVGVMGDQRTYAYTCAVRAVHSEDGMTADWTPLPYEVLKRISSRIVNEVRGINRVVYDITSEAARHHRVGVSARRTGASSASFIFGCEVSRLTMRIRRVMTCR